MGDGEEVTKGEMSAQGFEIAVHVGINCAIT